jgi:hypothetical protein
LPFRLHLISMVESRSGGLGYSNAKTARRALQILRLLGWRGTPPKPLAKLRNSPENTVRISGGKIVTRYTVPAAVASKSATGCCYFLRHRRRSGCAWPLAPCCVRPVSTTDLNEAARASLSSDKVCFRLRSWSILSTANSAVSCVTPTLTTARSSPISYARTESLCPPPRTGNRGR